MLGLLVFTETGKKWDQTELCKHVLEFVCIISCYDPEQKLFLFIFIFRVSPYQVSRYHVDLTALFDLRSFQNPEHVDKYFCWCCVCWCCFLPKKIGRGLRPALYIADYPPKKTHVTRFIEKITDSALWKRRQNIHV